MDPNDLSVRNLKLKVNILDGTLDDLLAQYNAATSDDQPRSQEQPRGSDQVAPRLPVDLQKNGCSGRGCFPSQEEISDEMRRHYKATENTNVPVFLPLLDSMGCRGSQCFGKRETESLSKTLEEELESEPCTGSQCLGRKELKDQRMHQESEKDRDDQLNNSVHARELLLKNLIRWFPGSYRGKRGGERRVYAVESRRANKRGCEGEKCVRTRVSLFPENKRQKIQQREKQKKLQERQQQEKQEEKLQQDTLIDLSEYI